MSTYQIRQYHGPICIPMRPQFDGHEPIANNPADYGRYQPIDLDSNNRHMIDRWCEKNPDAPRPSYGWGVCRHGFGLQNLPRLNAHEAETLARAFNAAIPIGQYADGQVDHARVRELVAA